MEDLNYPLIPINNQFEWFSHCFNGDYWGLMEDLNYPLIPNKD